MISLIKGLGRCGGPGGRPGGGGEGAVAEHREGPRGGSRDGGGGGSSGTHAGNHLPCHPSETRVMPFRVCLDLRYFGSKVWSFLYRVYKTAGCDVMVFSGHLVSLKDSV